MNKNNRNSMSDQVVSIFQPQRLIRIEAMTKLLNCSRTTLYRWVEKGQFPAPKKCGSRTLGWTLSQYEKWLSE